MGERTVGHKLHSNKNRIQFPAFFSTTPSSKPTIRHVPPKKKAGPSNVYAFLGTDDGKVKEAALKKSNELTPEEAGEFGLETIDGVSESVDDAVRICGETLQAIQTIPFFGGDKVVWLRGANFIGDNVTGRSERTLDALQSLIDVLSPTGKPKAGERIDGLPDSVTFIISATEVDKRRSFYKKLSALAQVEVFDQLDTTKTGWEGHVREHIQKRAKEKNVVFERDALELFVLLVGSNTRQIDGELEKLSLFVGKEPIKVRDVRTTVPLTRDGYIFHLGDAIGSRNLPEALRQIDHLLFQGENAIAILLAAIVPKVRNLFLAKDLAERAKLAASNYGQYCGGLQRLPEAETAHIPRTKEGKFNCYPIFLAAGEARNFSLPALRSGLASCLEANTRLVTSQLDPKLVLHQLVIRLLTS